MAHLLLYLSLACCVADDTTKSEPVTLVYEIEPATTSGGEKVDVERLIRQIENRLLAAEIQSTKVTQAKDSRISITLTEGKPESVERAKDVISRPGHVEFRVLADKRLTWHSDLIAAAAAKKTAGNEVRNEKNELIGKWARAIPALTLPDDIVRRKDKRGNEEILFATDPYDVTDECITQVKLSIDENEAEIHFTLTNEGGKRLGELTGTNLPEPTTGTASLLGAIVDDRLYTAAGIRSRITDSGRITGHAPELKRLAVLLKAGRLSAKLRLVSESRQVSP